MKLILSGIVLHLILISSIFDIYFTSPIIHGMTPQKCDINPPAKRLVLLVADGLRQESLYGPDISNFSHFEQMAPFLSSLVTNKQASWGISHTRVPTESRPGHVAITAGFYEDPSAIAKGWKENPVGFDSVFNQSYQTWAWGSPDIVPMFSKSPNVHTYSYSSEEEDFSGKMSTSFLDVWVFEKITKFFSDQQVEKLDVRSNQVIFFLHLLGLDTAGHTHKPNSKEHISNIKVVDDGIKGIVNTFEQFYLDNDTVYIFTADHGMTDWGSHGAGSAAETETPFIFWGSGIKTSITPMAIEQADLAPLMSTLIGIPIPVNSVGVLPDFSLNLSPEDLSSAVFVNARQIFMQYHVKRTRTQESLLPLFYKEFPEFLPMEFSDLFIKIQDAMDGLSFKHAINLSKQLILHSQQGLAYYHNYYQRLLLTFVSLAYIGWIVLLMLYVVGFTFPNVKYFSRIHIGLILSMSVTCVVLFVQSLPLTYYVYCLIPQYIWWKILTMSNAILSSAKLFWCGKLSLSTVIKITFYSIIVVEILVMSFFRREILSVALVIISVWPYNLRRVHVLFKICWTLTSLSLAIFPFLPVVGTTFNFFLVAATGVLWVFTHIILLYGPVLWLDHRISTPNHQLLAGCLQSVCVVFAVGNLFFIDTSITNKSGLPIASQFASWFLTGFALCLPFFGSTFIFERLINITMGCLVPFILMSVSYEPLFMLVLFLNLLLWLSIENAQFTASSKYLFTIPFGTGISADTLSNYRTNVVPEDVRRSLFILLFSVLAFFGMGNMASLNSFDPMWVRSYITVFNPFLMAALILFKILIPYIVVSCVFRAIATCLEASMKKIFYIVLILCDIMGLHFLFMVQNTGSWLEIGSSISHFIIVQTMVLFLLLLYTVAFVLTEYTVIKSSKYVRPSYLKVHVP